MSTATFDPVKRSPSHHRHAALGARFAREAGWDVPSDYGSVDEECRAVHEAVGLIDVSTLGKLELSGRDGGAFLDWLHPNRFSDMEPGRVRYRVMCDDAGIILDDQKIFYLALQEAPLLRGGPGHRCAVQGENLIERFAKGDQVGLFQLPAGARQLERINC